MARIYLDARNITDRPAGVARYALNLIPALVRQAPRHEYIVVRHSSNREPIEVLGYDLEEVYTDWHIDNAANVTLGAPVLRKIFAEHGEPDIYHTLFHLLPMGLQLAGADFKVVVTLHDLVWIDHPYQSQPTRLGAEMIRAFGRAAIPYALGRADHVICVSEPTARRARSWLEAGKYSTIYHGVSPSFFEEAAPPRQTLPDLVEDQIPYVVAIGNDKPYKNLDRLIDAFTRASGDLDRAHLVLVGSCDGLLPEIEWAGIEDEVTLTGFVDDRQLRRVLGHAHMFVFPSLVEGFGLPVLEAMAMGVPTVVSDLEPMRTIAGDAAVKVDPYHTGELADAIVRLMREPDLHARMVDRGQRRAAQFRWPMTARKTLQVYKKALEA